MGYVYLLRSNKKDTLKIGTTVDPAQRLKSFKSSSINLGIEDETFEFLHTVKVDKHYELENLLHKKFADKRVCGEWFNITAEEFMSMLESIDLSRFNKAKTKANKAIPIHIDNYVLLSALFTRGIYEGNLRFRVNLERWMRAIDHKYYDNHLYVNIEEIPFLFESAVWGMTKTYHTKRYFNEFIFYPLLDRLHSILTYAQILELFDDDDDAFYDPEEHITILDIINWGHSIHE